MQFFSERTLGLVPVESKRSADFSNGARIDGPPVRFLVEGLLLLAAGGISSNQKKKIPARIVHSTYTLEMRRAPPSGLKMLPSLFSPSAKCVRSSTVCSILVRNNIFSTRAFLPII